MLTRGRALSALSLFGERYNLAATISLLSGRIASINRCVHVRQKLPKVPLHRNTGCHSTDNRLRAESSSRKDFHSNSGEYSAANHSRRRPTALGREAEIPVVQQRSQSAQARGIGGPPHRR